MARAIGLHSRRWPSLAGAMQIAYYSRATLGGDFVDGRWSKNDSKNDRRSA